MKNNDLFELEKEDCLISLQDNKIYKYDISYDGFADYMLFKKTDDKIIICNANKGKKNSIKFLNNLETKDIQYSVIDYKSIENNTVEEFYANVLDRYNEFMQLYHNEELKNDFFVYNTQITLDNIKLTDFEEESNKLYYPVEIKETLSKVVYIREKNIEEAVDKVENLRRDGSIVLNANDFIEYEINEYTDNNSFTTKDKLNDYNKNNLKRRDLIYYLAFDDICSINDNATQEEVITIANACYQAWLKDDENYSITKFTTFITEKYFSGELSLEDIKYANPRDIINDSINDNLFFIKDVEEKEMER